MRDQSTIEKLKHFFQGNQEAVDLALMLVHILDVWDDLVDKDREPSEEEINRMMWFCISGLPRNRFYRQFQDELTPIFEVGVFNWIAADELKRRGGQKELEVANVIRHSVSDLFVHIARLIGGFQWAATVTPEIKLLAQNDTLEEYMKG